MNESILFDFLIQSSANPKMSWVASMYKQGITDTEILLEIFLDTDITQTSDVTGTSLNSQRQKYMLDKEILVQVDEIVDISQDEEQREKLIFSDKGTMKYLLNDAGEHMIGVSQKKIELIDNDSPPGIKIIILPGTIVRYGVFLLDDDHIKILGGKSSLCQSSKERILRSLRRNTSSFEALLGSQLDSQAILDAAPPNSIYEIPDDDSPPINLSDLFTQAPIRQIDSQPVYHHQEEEEIPESTSSPINYSVPSSPPAREPPIKFAPKSIPRNDNIDKNTVQAEKRPAFNPPGFHPKVTAPKKINDNQNSDKLEEVFIQQHNIPKQTKAVPIPNEIEIMNQIKPNQQYQSAEKQGIRPPGYFPNNVPAVNQYNQNNIKENDQIFIGTDDEDDFEFIGDKYPAKPNYQEPKNNNVQRTQQYQYDLTNDYEAPTSQPTHIRAAPQNYTQPPPPPPPPNLSHPNNIPNNSQNRKYRLAPVSLSELQFIQPDNSQPYYLADAQSCYLIGSIMVRNNEYILDAMLNDLQGEQLEVRIHDNFIQNAIQCPPDFYMSLTEDIKVEFAETCERELNNIKPPYLLVLKANKEEYTGFVLTTSMLERIELI